jgi:hypothetical protein
MRMALPPFTLSKEGEVCRLVRAHETVLRDRRQGQGGSDVTDA